MHDPSKIHQVLLTVAVVALLVAPAQLGGGSVWAEPCLEDSHDPTPTSVEVETVPIVVESTVEEYFVLYVLHDLGDSTLKVPVLVALGENGTTSLAENLPTLPKERYGVEKYLIADPADIDGDCIDDITELNNPGGMNPMSANPSTAALDLRDGAMSIPDLETYEELSYQGAVKFFITSIGTGDPQIYFVNTNTHTIHRDFLQSVSVDTGAYHARGLITFDPDAVALDGSLGVYAYNLTPITTWPFNVVDISYTMLAANMPLINDNLAFYLPTTDVGHYQQYASSYQASRINLLFADDFVSEDTFTPLNLGKGYGILRVMMPDERPSPRDVVIYETIPNDISRVAGIITTAPQTPLSHVNLRAVQDGVPNAFIHNALDNASIADLVDRYVSYKVTPWGWYIKAATPTEVNAHHASSRPVADQIPQRNLSVTSITPLSEVGFEDWNAFGVKAANLAVLGTLNFTQGTVPDGFAIPFYFYDEFMKHNALYDRIKTMLADPDFQTDLDTQESELKKLRKAITNADTPAWIVTALEEMHVEFQDGQSLRYRSSTNNEDLPGFNGAGLYDSKTQHPEETAEDGISKSLKQVYASLWNLRAYIERDFHRVDHTTTAMGVLIHPNYSDEKANGVAVSFDPLDGRSDTYYVNTQVGEDLVTNPDALSVPEEIKLSKTENTNMILFIVDPELPIWDYQRLTEIPKYTVVATSNQMSPWTLILSHAQMDQLRKHLAAIHDRFAELYGIEPDEEFAMEIEFKITSDDNLAIKQARPWVSFDYERPPHPTLTADAASPTTADSVQVTVDFGGPIDAATFEDSDISVTGGNATGIAGSPDNRTFTFTLTPSADGEVTVTIPANQVESSSGNGNVASNVLSVIFDRIGPAPTLTAASESPTDASVEVTVDFGEAIDQTTFTDSDISVTGGNATGLTHQSGDRTFTFTLTPSADGEVTVTIPANHVEDQSGNGNGASNALSITFDSVDTDPPEFESATYDVGKSRLTVTFSEPLNGTVITNALHIRESGQSLEGATSGAHAVSGHVLTVTFTASQNDMIKSMGDPELDIRQGAVSDMAGNRIADSDDNPIDFPFITTWQTTGTDETVTIPVGGTAGTYTVHWGDGTTSTDVQGDQSHVYRSPSTYTVSISGDFTRILLSDDDPANARNIMSIDQWGDITWASMKDAFDGASNMAYRATDTPNLSSVTDMSDMFEGASSFNGDLSGWNVSSVTDMEDVFRDSGFNQPLDSWDVSSVTNMKGMFRDAAFDWPLNSWNVSSVTDMEDVFRDSGFNQPLDSWDVSSVTNMKGMFRDAAFDWPLNSWNVSSVTDMEDVFRDSGFNQPLDSWDVSSVTNMKGMFRDSGFNQPLDSWDVSSVTNMKGMFRDSGFNQPLNSWDVSSVTNMKGMFRDSGFNQNLGDWYIVLDDTSIDHADSPGIVGAISAQNSFLDGQNPVYSIGSGHDSDSFEMNETNLELEVVPTKGSYAVIVTSTGDFGSDNSRTFDIDVSGFASNTPPTVDAGANQAVHEGDTVTLVGSASDPDNDSLTYTWSHDSDLVMELSGINAALASFIAPEVRSHTIINFTLAVSDGAATTSDLVAVTIADIPASNTTVILEPPTQSDSRDIGRITLTSTVPGTILASWEEPAEDPVNYRISWTKAGEKFRTWTDLSGNAFPTEPSHTITNLEEGEAYTMMVRASYDGTAGGWSGVVTITVAASDNRQPTVSAGPDQAVHEGDTVTLVGSATDQDNDQMTYQWTHDSTLPISIADNAALSTTFTAPEVAADTAVTFTLVASDGTDSAEDAVLITVQDVSESDFVTTWVTTEPVESITIPARGTYTVDWGDGTVEESVSGSRTHTYDSSGNHTIRISDGIMRFYLNGHADAPKLTSIDQWGDAQWTSMRSAFEGASNMAYNAADAPDLSRVIDTRYMFEGASSLDGDLSGWDVSNVRKMSYMFKDTTLFNSDLSGWDVSDATDVSGMFWNASSFDSDLSGWDVSSATDMYGMFVYARSFDSDLSGWDVSRVTGMGHMFYHAHSFDSDLSDWDVSSVTNMFAMFAGTRSFDSDLTSWDISRVTDMADMFRATSSFNGDISGWDISETVRLNSMLYRADAFDRNLGKWYIVLDGHAIRGDDVPGVVGNISTRNSYLDGQNPSYGIGSGGDSGHFEMDGNTLKMKSIPDHEGLYTVNITSVRGYGTDNSRTLEITVSESAAPAPVGPREVTGVNLTSTNSGTIVVSWDAPAESAKDYRVAWAKAGEKFATFRNLEGNAFPTDSQYAITDLEEGEEYKVMVRARYHSGGPGAWSDVFTIEVASTN